MLWKHFPLTILTSPFVSNLTSPFVNNTIFISVFGGRDGSHLLNTAEHFDIRRPQFNHLAPMRGRRSGASAAVINGKIYVAGGWSFSNFKYLTTVEMFVVYVNIKYCIFLFRYDPRADRWMHGPALNKPRSWFSLFSDENQLLALGGYNGYFFKSNWNESI